MAKYDYEADEDLERPRKKGRSRRRPLKMALPSTIVLVLGIAGLLILLAFVIRGAGLAVAFVGFAICIIAQLWFLAVAAADNVLQVLLCLFVPFYSLFYLIMNWEEEKWPFALNLLGLFIIFGSLIAGGIREGISTDDPADDRMVDTDRRDRNPPPWQPPKEQPKEQPKEPPKADPKDPTNPTRPFDVDPNAKKAGKTVYLTALTPYGFEGSPWKYAVGKTGERHENAIKVQNKEYKFGIQATPPDAGSVCRVNFVPGGEFKRFKGWGGINDYRTDPQNPTVFSILGDGTRLWESEPLAKAGAAVEFDIDVTGIKVLTLETRVIQGSNFGAHAVWLDPWLER